MKNFAQIVAVLLAVAAYGQDVAPKDVDGWQGAKWGMSEAEVMRAFDGRIKLLPQSASTPILEMTLPDLVLEDLKCEVRFRLDADKKLAIVTLDVKQFSSTPAVAFSQLDRLLTEKYGVPATVKDKAERWLVNRERTWIFPSSTIMAYIISFAAPGYPPRDTVAVVYRKRVKNSNL